ncbi:UDP-N-acetylmuramoyl-L-alanine--D-glutamate ligase [Candidatus Peregrinibacteria bacterium]|nr:UDP-N-acetylmuramoyl-L-alanine--D-glutamate ligase [Candidatus Peregrinibacteria bacterium]
MNQRSKIAVVGYGVEGQAMLDYLVKNNFSNITVCDYNVTLKKKMPDGVSVRLGEHYLEGLEDFDVVFRSPGVNSAKPEFAKARMAGTVVTSSTQYFLEQVPCTVIGVTGTKGKGTTSTLIYEILKAHFRGGRKSVFLGGNIGNSPIEFLDKLKRSSVVVLEMSCFQLGDLQKSPKIAVILNTTTDHLDYYPDRGAYMQAKELILNHQDRDDLAVLNADYPYVKYYKPLVKGGVKLVSVKGRRVEDGVQVKDGTIYYVTDGKEEKIMPVSKIALVGSHNLENVGPAIVVAKEFGVTAKAIAKVVAKFKGLPHRIEFVGRKKGVAYYNDSFSTNPMTSVAAIDSFDEPTFLIAGGSDKGLKYGVWAKRAVLKSSLKGVILNGETAMTMKKALDRAGAGKKGSGMKVVVVDDLESAFAKAREMAEKASKTVRKRKGGAKGAVVVMSPAAASFDQFSNYKERGKKFGKMV